MVGDVGRLLQVWQTGSVSQPEEMAGGGVVEEAGGVVGLGVVGLLHHHPAFEGVGLGVRHWGGEAGETVVRGAEQAGQAAGVQARLQDNQC